MTRKSHHVTHHLDGGWDVKKGGGSGQTAMAATPAHYETRSKE